ncbi:HemK2/MTQ2 family protein methyltransferase [Streptomyces sp. NPDC102467]|uniref:HemK2/MTQ2 family protein methyltransferase n=1 Tax=Streptomyces sp. NPDC102467 TaxID=3366179 RepID=UPI0038003A2D
MTALARAGQLHRPPPRLLAPPGVYAPQYDTELLIRALGDEPVGGNTKVLDLGTGSGALALAAARLGARVTAVDLSWRAVWTARLNARIHRTPITVRHGDLGAAFAPGSFDLIVSNPPYVPAPSRLPPRHGAAQAWDGGLDGRIVVDRVCAAAARALRPGGTLLMVHSGLCDASASLGRLADLGMEAAVTDRIFVPFGPVLRARRAWLCARGLLDDDAIQEELVVIRAELL